MTNIHPVGVNDRHKTLFEGLWPLPYGVSYNSYIIDDEKVALVDTVEVDFFSQFIDNVRRVIGDRPIDYIIVNHMEPDHSGSLALIKKYYPDAKIVGNKKTFDMMRGYYNVGNEEDEIVEVKNGDTLSLGTHQLAFTMIPMVHWPETMVTLDVTEHVLFSGDAFGCFGALNGAYVDSEMNCDVYWNEMQRYYSNIVGKYGVPVQQALKKLAGVKNIVIHDVSRENHSFILSDIFKYRGLILGAPTYNNGLYPEMEMLLSELAERGIKDHLLGIFGSYTWAGQAVKKITEWNKTRMKFELVGIPAEIKQSLSTETEAACEALGKAMAERLK